MANLLDQASIVLTPTAYDNGKVLCAKPSEPPYGDFDFSRNSAATRVNAQGLVENVQILSSNLVQNPSFSEEGVQEVSNGSFSQEGAQLVTNGSFDTDTDWNTSGNWTIGNGVATYDGLSNTKRIYQTINFVQNKMYKISFDVTETDDGTIRLFFGQNATTLVNTNNYAVGSYVFYVTATTTSQVFSIYAYNSNSGGGSIDNCSIREVGQDWSLGTGWSIAEDTAISDGSVVGNSYLISTGNTLTIGKTYKVQYTVLDYISGQVKVTAGQATQSFVNADGTYTEYMVATSTEPVRAQANSNFNGSITNISVKEVGQNWNIENTWTIGNSVANGNGANGSSEELKQSNILTIGKKYKLTYEIKNWVSGTVKGGPSGAFNSGDGIYTEYFTSNRTALAFLGINFFGDITNISVIEITDDTNLPRINYEGFSYQDALGSELNPNTYIADKSANLTLNGTQLQIDNGGENYARARANVVLVSGKTYRAKVTCINQGTNGASFYVLAARPFGTINMISGETYEVTFVADSFYTPFYENKVGGSGLIVDNISIKEYLGQEVVPDSGCGSWLFEPQSTNLISYSEDFSDSSWVKSNMTVTPNSIISPDGTLNADELNGQYIYANINVLGNTVYTFSFYVKNNSATNPEYAIYDLTNNSFIVGETSYLSEINNDTFVRVSVTFTTASNTLVIRPYPSRKANTTIYIWGAMLEQGNISSYIPTEGSTVTRNQDVCTNGGSLASINSTSGTLYFEGAALSDDGTNRAISINDGTTANRVSIVLGSGTNEIRGQVISSGTSFDFTTTSYNVLNNNKIAISYKLNDFSMWVNGTKVSTDTSGNTPSGMNVINFNAGGTVLPYYGKTKALAVWKEALSDEELADLTYPTPTDPTFALDFDTIATDFTFARGSEATYVDAQGLIQSTNELGPELVINGDFAIDSDWNLGANVTISGGKANVLNAQQGERIQQNFTSLSTKTYKVIIKVSNYVSGIVGLYMGGSYVATGINSNGTFIYYHTPPLSFGEFFIRSMVSGTTFSIDNVSVKEYITETNTPRLDYSTGAEAFLLEPQGTNLIPYSEDFSESWWFANTADVVLSTNLSPDGTQNAYEVTYGSSGNRLGGANFGLPNTPNTNSIYIRKVSGSGVVDFVDQLGASNTINISEDWKRYNITRTLSDGTARLYVDLQALGDKIEVYGAQQEQLPYATSYIPTEGSTVTRNQETCINATPEINSEEGVLYAEIAALANENSQRILSVSDGTNSNVVQLGLLNSTTDYRFFASVRVGGVSQAFLAYNFGAVAPTFKKCAIKYKQNDFALWIDGVEVATDTSGNTPIGLNELTFTRGDAGQNFFGNTKDVQVYTKALSDAELIKLTT